ncbi:MAG: hypothetical protein IBJ18_02565 [Phycisphaerales bacterium]|nr:hypothetical protein [Phycisphaerales bacterium]
MSSRALHSFVVGLAAASISSAALAGALPDLGTPAGPSPITPGTGLQASAWWGSFASNIAAAETFSQSRSADATWISSVNYNTTSASTNILNWIGATDAATFTGVPGASSNATGRAVYIFTGFINLTSPGIWYFGVSSDDGFRLRINGSEVAQFNGDRGTALTLSGPWNALAAGLYSVELLYWANEAGDSAVVFSAGQGSPTAVSPVGRSSLYSVIPAPTAGALLGLGGLVATRRRR